MKGALLLVKNTDLYDGIINAMAEFGCKYAAGPTGICLYVNDGSRFVLYNRREDSYKYDEFEIPEKAKELGYKFAYLIECRSEDDFCAVIKSVDLKIDILIVDSDGQLFFPSEVDPDKISL